MKENPKMLYSIRNKQKNRRNEIGPFKENDEIIHDTEVILEKQLLEFISQFSEKTDEINENIFQNEDPDDLNDIEVTEKEIIQAINDLDENSAAGPDGVPAILLKNVKETLALPLSLMHRKSIDEGKIPDILKLAYVTPIHKSSSREKPNSIDR